jgi:rRNA maturation RNase YbeY
VITFPECSDKSIGGEIYISIERVKENAKLFKVDFETELNRIIIHGVLHLMKYTDSKISDKSVMTAKENLLLSLF